MGECDIEPLPSLSPGLAKYPHTLSDGSYIGGAYSPEYYRYQGDLDAGTWNEGMKAIEDFDWVSVNQRLDDEAANVIAGMAIAEDTGQVDGSRPDEVAIRAAMGDGHLSSQTALLKPGNPVSIKAHTAAASLKPPFVAWELTRPGLCTGVGFKDEEVPFNQPTWMDHQPGYQLAYNSPVPYSTMSGTSNETFATQRRPGHGMDEFILRQHPCQAFKSAKFHEILQQLPLARPQDLVKSPFDPDVGRTPNMFRNAKVSQLFDLAQKVHTIERSQPGPHATELGQKRTLTGQYKQHVIQTPGTGRTAAIMPGSDSQEELDAFEAGVLTSSAPVKSKIPAVIHPEHLESAKPYHNIHFAEMGSGARGDSTRMHFPNISGLPRVDRDVHIGNTPVGVREVPSFPSNTYITDTGLTIRPTISDKKIHSDEDEMQDVRTTDKPVAQNDPQVIEREVETEPAKSDAVHSLESDTHRIPTNAPILNMGLKASYIDQDRGEITDKNTTMQAVHGLADAPFADNACAIKDAARSYLAQTAVPAAIPANAAPVKLTSHTNFTESGRSAQHPAPALRQLRIPARYDLPPFSRLQGTDTSSNKLDQDPAQHIDYQGTAFAMPARPRMPTSNAPAANPGTPARPTLVERQTPKPKPDMTSTRKLGVIKSRPGTADAQSSTTTKKTGHNARTLRKEKQDDPAGIDYVPFAYDHKNGGIFRKDEMKRQLKLRNISITNLNTNAELEERLRQYDQEHALQGYKNLNAEELRTLAEMRSIPFKKSTSKKHLIQELKRSDAENVKNLPELVVRLGAPLEEDEDEPNEVSEPPKKVATKAEHKVPAKAPRIVQKSPHVEQRQQPSSEVGVSPLRAKANGNSTLPVLGSASSSSSKPSLGFNTNDAVGYEESAMKRRGMAFRSPYQEGSLQVHETGDGEGVSGGSSGDIDDLSSVDDGIIAEGQFQEDANNNSLEGKINVSPRVRSEARAAEAAAVVEDTFVSQPRSYSSPKTYATSAVVVKDNTIPPSATYVAPKTRASSTAITAIPSATATAEEDEGLTPPPSSVTPHTGPKTRGAEAAALARAKETHKRRRELKLERRTERATPSPAESSPPKKVMTRASTRPKSERVASRPPELEKRGSKRSRGMSCKE